MEKIKQIYVMDPLCGWNYSCYPTLLVQKSNKTFVLEQGHAGFETIVNEINMLIY